MGVVRVCIVFFSFTLYFTFCIYCEESCSVCLSLSPKRMGRDPKPILTLSQGHPSMVIRTLEWGSGIKTHSLGGACISHTGSELQLYVLCPYLTRLRNLLKRSSNISRLSADVESFDSY